MKINVSIKDDLLEKVDAYAKANYLSRSALITAALQEFLVAEELSRDPNKYMETVSNLAEALKQATKDK